MSPDSVSARSDGPRFTRAGAPTDAEAERVRRGQVRRALMAGTVGTAIEWYDFFLYGTAAALVFPKLFFPGASPYVGALASFATYAVGFAARPVGAAIFGHFGDRVGRKATLVTTLLGHRERPDRAAAGVRLDRIPGAHAARRPAPRAGHRRRR